MLNRGVFSHRSHLICIFCNHLVTRHTHEFARDAFASLIFSSGKHGDVASHRTPSMRLEFADYDSDQFIFGIDGL